MGNGDEAGTDVSLGDWSGLQCRVEEGFSRMSKVLEDGTIQVIAQRSALGFGPLESRFQEQLVDLWIG